MPCYGSLITTTTEENPVIYTVHTVPPGTASLTALCGQKIEGDRNGHTGHYGPPSLSTTAPNLVCPECEALAL